MMQGSQKNDPDSNQRQHRHGAQVLQDGKAQVHELQETEEDTGTQSHSGRHDTAHVVYAMDGLEPLCKEVLRDTCEAENVKIGETVIKYTCPFCMKEYGISELDPKADVWLCKVCEEIWPMSYHVLEKRFVTRLK